MVKTFSDPNKMKYTYARAGAYQMRTSGNITGISVSGGRSDNSVGKQLTEVQHVHQSLTELKNQCFRDCTALKYVNLSESGVKKIGNQCFAGCTALAEALLGDRVEEIGSNVFSGCTALKSLRFDWATRDNADGVQFNLNSIDGGMLDGCQLLTDVVLPCSAGCLNPNALNGANLSAFTLTGSDSSQLMSSLAARTKLFGIGQPCKVVTSDGKIVAFNGSSLSIESDFQGSSGVAQSGTAGKMRLGKIYQLSRDLIQWCETEKTPYVVIYCDTMTDFWSRTLCKDILLDQSFRKSLTEDFKYFMFFADRSADFSGQTETTSYYRQLMKGSTNHPTPNNIEFAQISFIYNGQTDHTTVTGVNASQLIQILKQHAKSTGFESWDGSKYDVKADIPDDETIPSGSLDPTGIQQYGVPHWFDGSSVEQPSQWDAGAEPADFKLVSTPDTTYLLIFANDAAHGVNGMDGDNTWAKAFYADYSDHVNVINGSASTKQKLIMGLQEGCKYHLFLFKESCHGGQYSSKDYCEYIAIRDYTAKKTEQMFDYEFAEALKNAKNRIFGIFQSCESGTMFDNETPNTDSPTFKTAKNVIPLGERVVMKMTEIKNAKLAGLRGEGPQVQSTLDAVNAIFWSACRAGTSTWYRPGGGYAPNSLFLKGLDQEFDNLTCPRYTTLWEKMRTNPYCTCRDQRTQCVPQVHTFGNSFKTVEAFR